eukprot:CAMPEP_0185764668 /NCGR_PEP_ID=MMETSP1174-20130828/23637_1 /TAXON_ID=35687 /ORGANISM="Dictyocha speculum, Strain CCMP1381" /LENGTH=257 /DNA_ID=CAMNT_0028447313 /DNA_START=185 /DNA_END=954 /DNA_ORIENTATION=-
MAAAGLMSPPPHDLSSAFASEIELTLITLRKPSPSVGATNCRFHVSTIRSPVPNGIVGWSTRFITRCLHTSAPAVKCTAVASAGVMASCSHLALSATVALHRSSTTLPPPFFLCLMLLLLAPPPPPLPLPPSSTLPTMDSHASRDPVTSWQTWCQPPRFNPPHRASEKVLLPDPGSPHSSTKLGAAFAQVLAAFRAWAAAFVLARETTFSLFFPSPAASPPPPPLPVAAPPPLCPAVADGTTPSFRSSPMETMVAST